MRIDIRNLSEESENKYIIKEPIYCGNILIIDEGQLLTHEIIEKIKKFNIDSKINVEKETTELITDELKEQIIHNTNNLNVDSFIKLAKDIVDQVSDNKHIIKSLNELKKYCQITYNHSINVAVISTVIGLGYDLPWENLCELSTAALLHDIGKKAINKEILDKPGKLNEEEFNEIKKHPLYGYNMVFDNNNLSWDSKCAIIQHHENEDGTGYPLQRKGNELKLYSKIIHLADIYEAMTAKRPYKDAHPNFECVEYLMGNSGGLINEEVLKTFLRCCPAYAKDSEVTLSTGEKAIVIENNELLNLRPTVETKSGKIIKLSLPVNNNITIIK